MIGVVALLSRPRFLLDVLANFERQTHPDKLLVIVENGPGLGACRALGGGGYSVTTSEPDRSCARNVGIEHLRELGIEHFAFFEDDDVYLPGYLAEHWANRERADILGKICFVLEHWPTRERADSRWLLHSEWETRQLELVGPYPGYLMAGPVGSTIFGRVDRALPWPEPCPAYAEELDWCTDMLRARRTVRATSREHFVRRRFDGPDHGHATPGDWRHEVQGGLRLDPAVAA